MEQVENKHILKYRNHGSSIYLKERMSVPILNTVFEDVTEVPGRTAFYDYICKSPRKEFIKKFNLNNDIDSNTEYKVDSRLAHLNGKNGWVFQINKVADLFLYIAIGQNKIYTWLIKGDENVRGYKINKTTLFSIYLNIKSRIRFQRFEIDIYKIEDIAHIIKNIKSAMEEKKERTYPKDIYVQDLDIDYDQIQKTYQLYQPYQPKGVLEPVKLEDIRHGHYIRKDVVCRLCGSDKTRIQSSNGMPLWVKDKDIHRNETGQYLCYDCAYPDIDTRKCSMCGGNEILLKVFDRDAYWTGKYECQFCVYNRARKGKQHGIRRRTEEGT